VSTHCRVCKRALKNPLFVELGIGPVCRARDSLQGEFDFMRAEIELIKHEADSYILVRDIGHNKGRSVTNDADYVVKLIYEDYDISDNTRIFYEDSSGRIDELLHNGKIFTGYKAGHEGIEL